MVNSAFATFGSLSIFMDERKLLGLLRHLSQLQFLKHQLWKIKTWQNKNLLPDQQKATTKIELSHYLKQHQCHWLQILPQAERCYLNP